MKRNRTSLLAVAALAAAMLFPALAPAQVYNTQQPTYIPTAVTSQVTRTTTGAVPSFTLQGLSTFTFRIGGTFSALVATVEVANDIQAVADAAATWKTVTAFPVGSSSGSQGAPVESITAAGLYRVDVSGMTRVRLNVSTLTGTNITVAQAATPAEAKFGGANLDLGAAITNTARASGTTTSSDFINVDGKGVTCTLVTTTESGSPTVAWSIQQKDAVSGAYFSLLTGTVTFSQILMTAGAQTQVMSIYPGIQTSSLPTGMSAINLHLPRVWRLTQTISGSATPNLTSTTGCQALL